MNDDPNFDDTFMNAPTTPQTERSFADEAAKPPRRTKAHRTCYFWPIWKQWGMPSQAAFDMVRWGQFTCEEVVKEGPSHPRYTRAVAALEALKEAAAKFEAAKKKLKDTLSPKGSHA